MKAGDDKNDSQFEEGKGENAMAFISWRLSNLERGKVGKSWTKFFGGKFVGARREVETFNLKENGRKDAESQ